MVGESLESISPVRVRFAPSPTGSPHIGNIRTALFNFLFARANNGKMILRIEDTDQGRKSEGAVEEILSSLQWLGINWDEGPYDEAGGSAGDYGPYFQSQRLDIYNIHANNLIDSGLLYHCFCSSERLDQLRKENQLLKQPIKYDRHCLKTLDKQKRVQLAESGQPHILRFYVRSQNELIVLNDIIRNDVSWDPNLIDDFIAIKSDGFPTYHFANVVDDHLMNITHVLRAEEWLSSSPRHLLLYQAFGWKAPNFAHLPMILGTDRSKLSKRHGSTALLEYRKKGLLPETMINFMALLGWALDDKTEFFSYHELVDSFSLDRVTKSGAIFDFDKLNWMNGAYIRALSIDDLLERSLPYLERTFIDGGLHDDVKRPIDKEYLRQILVLVQERIKTLDELTYMTSIFFLDIVDYEGVEWEQNQWTIDDIKSSLESVLSEFRSINSWELGVIEKTLRTLAENLDVKAGRLFGLLRLVVTGRPSSPPLFQMLHVLGKKRTCNRVEAVLSIIGAE
tara:strand:- start:4107 stop:5633 length:1527 start_codon:yes stop_codon:yes gene_type:complete